MHRLSVFLYLVALFFCGSVSGQDFGVGIIAGHPTGVTAKKWLHDGKAIAATAAWSFDDRRAFQLNADYLWHHDIPVFSDVSSGWLPFYYGIGGQVKFKDGSRRNRDSTRAGVRIPVGVTYLFENAPVDIFFEVAPVLEVAPRTDFELNAAAGVRFYLR